MPRYASRQIALCVGLHRLIQFDLFAGGGVFYLAPGRARSLGSSIQAPARPSLASFAALAASEHQTNRACSARPGVRGIASHCLNPLKLRKTRRRKCSFPASSRARARRCDKTLCSTTWGPVTRNSPPARGVDVGARARFSKLAALAASRHQSNRASC